jgi:hypothetical protein
LLDNRAKDDFFVPHRCFATAQFFTDALGTVFKMYWTVAQATVQISVQMDFKLLKQGGWFAVRA